MGVVSSLVKHYSQILIPPEVQSRIIRKLSIGSYEFRLNKGAVKRPHYGYCVLNAAKLAAKIGYEEISVIEFGVAGGNGLVNLEYHAEQVEKLTGVKINIYGFDTGEGLPVPVDFRDLPYHWQAGFFKMNKEVLLKRLKRAKVVFGDISNTVETFLQEYNPAPIGAVFFDMDFYSSTINAFKIFDGSDEYFLPRIFNYFDDIIGSELELYNDYTGERLAIREFNSLHDSKKLSPAYHLIQRSKVVRWQYQIYIYHNFKHEKYNHFISGENQQLPMSTKSGA
jgi:hypothetical protein